MERGAGDGPARRMFRQAVQAARDRAWQEAAERYAEALSMTDSPPPRWHFLYGMALLELDHYHHASDAFRQAIAAHRDAPPHWHFQSGLTLARQRDWAAAAEAFTSAIEKGGTSAPTRWHLKLGVAQEGLDDLQGAAHSYARALDLDPQTSPLDRRILAADAKWFERRRRIVHFLEPRIDEIRARALDSSHAVAGRSDRVFGLWLQGVENAPEVVQACHRQLHRATARDVVYLDAESLPRFAQLPADIDRLEMTPAHRADLMRVELLARHGGIWLDATCLVRDDFDERIADLMGSGFFAFEKRGVTLSNWLLSVAGPDHYLILMLREALHTYWRHFREAGPYLFFHYIFEGLLHLDEGVRQTWDDTPGAADQRPQLLRARLQDPFDARVFQESIDRSFVHKLNRRYPPEAVSGDTMLAHILRAY